MPHAELGAYYERAAVVCVPSRREGYGVVAREAMAYGRPVVATRVGGLADAVVDGETGVAVAPGDIEGLRSVVTSLLADAKRRASLGAAGRASVGTHAGPNGLRDALERAAGRSRT